MLGEDDDHSTNEIDAGRWREPRGPAWRFSYGYKPTTPSRNYVKLQKRPESTRTDYSRLGVLCSDYSRLSQVD
jgi:hypothetical protein